MKTSWQRRRVFSFASRMIQPISNPLCDRGEKSTFPYKTFLHTTTFPKHPRSSCSGGTRCPAAATGSTKIRKHPFSWRGLLLYWESTVNAPFFKIPSPTPEEFLYIFGAICRVEILPSWVTWLWSSGCRHAGDSLESWLEESDCRFLGTTCDSCSISGQCHSLWAH